MDRRAAIATSCMIAAMVVCRAAPAEEPAARNQAPTPATASDDQIALWIAQLDGGQYQVRERATQNLLGVGELALDALLTAANGDRPEPADRAVWILQQLAESPEHELALAALDRLVQLRHRPDLAEEAGVARAQLRIVLCQQQLAPLGGRLTTQLEQIDPLGVVTVVHVRLGDGWRGTSDDLRGLAQLEHQPCFRLEGAEVDDAVVRLFEKNDNLAMLQLIDTRVTPAAVDALKNRQPKAVVYVRNQALMGIAAQSHAQGVLVTMVQPGTGAASAGIETGDVIASIDGRPLPDFDRLTARIAQHDPGDKVDVEIVRGGKRLRKQVTLGSWEMLP